MPRLVNGKSEVWHSLILNCLLHRMLRVKLSDYEHVTIIFQRVISCTFVTWFRLIMVVSLVATGN